MSYQPKMGAHVPKDIKEYVLKRVRESGKTIKDIASEHGMSRGTINRWLKEGSGESNTELIKLQKENQTLKQLVAELSLLIRENQKKNW